MCSRFFVCMIMGIKYTPDTIYHWATPSPKFIFLLSGWVLQPQARNPQLQSTEWLSKPQRPIRKDGFIKVSWLRWPQSHRFWAEGPSITPCCRHKAESTRIQGRFEINQVIIHETEKSLPLKSRPWTKVSSRNICLYTIGSCFSISPEQGPRATTKAEAWTMDLHWI